MFTSSSRLRSLPFVQVRFATVTSIARRQWLATCKQQGILPLILNFSSLFSLLRLPFVTN